MRFEDIKFDLSFASDIPGIRTLQSWDSNVVDHFLNVSLNYEYGAYRGGPNSEMRISCGPYRVFEWDRHVLVTSDQDVEDLLIDPYTDLVEIKL